MPTQAKSQDTRERILAAAFETLRRDGYAGTTVRAIARESGLNSALIFYYFGSLNGLLLAALDHSAELRMRRYREAVDRAENLADLVGVAARIYREDLEGGHITVFSELVGASLSNPALAPEIVRRAEPWIDFVTEAVEGALRGSAWEGMIPARDVAFGLISFYLGVNLMTHLEEDRSRADSLFALAERFAPALSAPPDRN